jgi:Zn finger protein HypA/HybF involved in hydrogenase expression
VELMTEVQLGDRSVPADIRRWDPDLRRITSLILGGVAVFLLVGALVYYELDPASSGWFLWVAIVTLVVLLLAEAAVLLTGIAREENVGPPWLAGETAEAETDTRTETTAVGPEPDEEPEPHREHPEIDLQCPECAEMFAVEDTGERPLATECPHCGAQGHVNLPDRDEDTGPEPGGAVGGEAEDPLAGLGEDDEDEDVEMISLECPACETQFETEDTGERPLRATCPGCGASGKLDV